jgi:hypothetical protein
MPGADGASPYLTVFAACMGTIDMTDKDGARHVLTAIRDTGAADADRNRLTAIILNLASNAARQTLETLMTAAEWTTHPFIESFKKEGIKEGRQAGIAEAKAEDVLKLIDARGIKATKEQRTEVAESTDLAQLDKWFDRALTAKKAADIFQD